MPKKTEETLNFLVKKITEKYQDVIAIYLFGSFGTEYENANSDVDLALSFKTSPDTVELWNFAQELAVGINKDVELIDLKRSTTVFQFEVLRLGKRVYCQDEGQADKLENLWISMYLRFNEERKDLLTNG
jgi:predicted nucleotidyltransferase